MFVFTALVALGSLGLLFSRWKRFDPSDGMDFVLSKEILTLVLNLILISILLVCLLGVIYPLVSELLTGTQITVGPEWYKRITGPLFLLLLLLTGISPLATWSETDCKRRKNFRADWFDLADLSTRDVADWGRASCPHIGRLVVGGAVRHADYERVL